MKRQIEFPAQVRQYRRRARIASAMDRPVVKPDCCGRLFSARRGSSRGSSRARTWTKILSGTETEQRDGPVASEFDSELLVLIQRQLLQRGNYATPPLSRNLPAFPDSEITSTEVRQR